MTRRHRITAAYMGIAAFALSIPALFVGIILIMHYTEPTGTNLAIVCLSLIGVVISFVLINACDSYAKHQTELGFSDPGPDFRI